MEFILIQKILKLTLTIMTGIKMNQDILMEIVKDSKIKEAIRKIRKIRKKKNRKSKKKRKNELKTS